MPTNFIEIITNIAKITIDDPVKEEQKIILNDLVNDFNNAFANINNYHELIENLKPKVLSNLLYTLGTLAHLFTIDNKIDARVWSAIIEKLLSVHISKKNSKLLIDVFLSTERIIKSNQLNDLISADLIEVFLSRLFYFELNTQEISSLVYTLGLIIKSGQVQGFISVSVLQPYLDQLSSVRLDVDAQFLANLLYGLGLVIQAHPLREAIVIPQSIFCADSYLGLNPNAHEMSHFFYGRGLLANLGCLDGNIRISKLALCVTRFLEYTLCADMIAKLLCGFGMMAEASQLEGKFKAEELEPCFKRLLTLKYSKKDLTDSVEGLRRLAQIGHLEGDISIGLLRELYNLIFEKEDERQFVEFIHTLGMHEDIRANEADPLFLENNSDDDVLFLINQCKDALDQTYSENMTDFSDLELEHMKNAIEQLEYHSKNEKLLPRIRNKAKNISKDIQLLLKNIDDLLVQIKSLSSTDEDLWNLVNQVWKQQLPALRNSKRRKLHFNELRMSLKPNDETSSSPDHLLSSQDAMQSKNDSSAPTPTITKIDRPTYREMILRNSNATHAETPVLLQAVTKKTKPNPEKEPTSDNRKKTKQSNKKQWESVEKPKYRLPDIKKHTELTQTSPEVTNIFENLNEPSDLEEVEVEQDTSQLTAVIATKTKPKTKRTGRLHEKDNIPIQSPMEFQLIADIEKVSHGDPNYLFLAYHNLIIDYEHLSQSPHYIFLFRQTLACINLIIQDLFQDLKKGLSISNNIFSIINKDYYYRLSYLKKLCKYLSDAPELRTPEVRTYFYQLELEEMYRYQSMPGNRVSDKAFLLAKHSLDTIYQSVLTEQKREILAYTIRTIMEIAILKKQGPQDEFRQTCIVLNEWTNDITRLLYQEGHEVSLLENLLELNIVLGNWECVKTLFLDLDIETKKEQQLPVLTKVRNLFLLIINDEKDTVSRELIEINNDVTDQKLDYQGFFFVHFLLGIAHEQIGEKNKALEHYRKIIVNQYTINGEKNELFSLMSMLSIERLKQIDYIRERKPIAAKSLENKDRNFRKLHEHVEYVIESTRCLFVYYFYLKHLHSLLGFYHFYYYNNHEESLVCLSRAEGFFPFTANDSENKVLRAHIHQSSVARNLHAFFNCSTSEKPAMTGTEKSASYVTGDPEVTYS